jgi:class 3 adenylate cyclase
MPEPRAQKTLTVMFTDISGFTRHTERVSREAMMERLDAHNALLLPIVAHFEGRIIKTIGDAFLIVFDSPTNAVQCGMLMQHSLQAFNADKPPEDEIHIKVSLNTGEVTVTADDVFGDPVNVAAKIEKATQPDEIYFTESVFLSMNKSEVPNAFVKTFRPRGAESQEIKLYKVIQDPADERYERIVNGTQIDTQVVKRRVAELSHVAEKEFRRYQDTLDHVLAKQVESASTMRKVAFLGGVAVAFLALGVIYMLGQERGAQAGPGEQMMAAARQYLTSGHPEDAERLVDEHVAAHGAGTAVEQMRAEIKAFRLNGELTAIKPLLAAGEPAGLARLRAAVAGGASGDEWDQLAARADAYAAGSSALDAGEYAQATAHLQRARSALEPWPAVERALLQTDALTSVGTALREPPGSEAVDAEQLLAQLTRAFGDDTGHPRATALMERCLARLLYDLAKQKGPEAGHEAIKTYRERFPHLGSWRKLAREVDLGGLWIYASSYEWQKQWRGWGPKSSGSRIRALREAGKGDAAFLYRLGRTCVAIGQKLHMGTIEGESDFREALALDPTLLVQQRDAFKEMALAWLRWEQRDGSLGRELLTNTFFEEVRGHLESRLHATYDPQDREGPRPSERANCLAILIAAGHPIHGPDARRFVENHLSLFLEDNEPELTDRHALAIFGGEMDYGDYVELREMLQGHLEDTVARKGRYATMKPAPDRLRALIGALDAGQADHALTYAAR